jgi:ribosome recycling factor
VDGSSVRLNIPPLTEERRKDLAKQIHRRMEEARIEIRGLRRENADQLKKEEHDGAVGADEVRRELEQLQRITDKHILDVDRVGAAKELEIMEV